jgi:benzoate/toluate 1,2-dioxygenase reductase subunit
MVDAVQKHFKDIALSPVSFHYEKFTPNATTPISE